MSGRAKVKRGFKAAEKVAKEQRERNRKEALKRWQERYAEIGEAFPNVFDEMSEEEILGDVGGR